MELVGGDDQGENTTVDDELYAFIFIIRVQIRLSNVLDNWFVLHIIIGEQV